MSARRILRALLLVAGLAACTPREIRLWQDWHTVDPAAAEAFANLPEVQASLQQTSQPATQQAPALDVRRGDVWDRLAECESGRSWEYNGGSGYDGGLQFAPSTWRGFGGQQFAEFAWQATREQQITVAERVLESQGWRAWPACSRKLGLR